MPDLRGEFLRGTGTNTHVNQGSGAEIGAHQDGTITKGARIDNSKQFVTAYDSTTPSYFNFSNADKTISSEQTGANGRIWTKFSNSDNEYEYFSYTSRPTNTSVLFCIKAKNG